MFTHYNTYCICMHSASSVVGKKVSAEVALELEEKAKMFGEEFKACKEEFSKSKEKIYYLVSCKFIREWIEYCTSTSEMRPWP